MKRFYNEAVALKGEDGWSILLDGKPIRTPAGNALTVPTETLAEKLAAEWREQGENIDRATLRLTALASLAIDVLAIDPAPTVEELLEYGETDLICYREEGGDLRRRQDARWQGWVEWARNRYGVALHVTDGVMPLAQPAANRERYREALAGMNTWRLAGLVAAVKISTSLALGLAFMESALDAGELLELARLEEDFQAEQWGWDAEAAARRENQRRELQAAQSWRDALQE